MKRKWRWPFLVEPYYYVSPPYTYTYAPTFDPKPRPEPWRKHELAKRQAIYLLPVSFCELLADDQQVHNNRKKTPNKIAWLRESISEEGLKRPCILVLDSVGNLRYHDGYHRLTAIQQIEDFTHIPCILQHSTGRIRSYGRPLHQITEIILELVSADNKA